MYTHGLTDRFGSPLISRRDLINGLKFLDARGNEVTPDDKWGKKIEVTVDDKIINVFHKDDWVMLDENFVGKDGITFRNDKVFISQDETVNLQTEKIISSVNCTDLLIKAFSPNDFNKPFSNLRLIEGEETEAIQVSKFVKYDFSNAETIKTTKFCSQLEFVGDFTNLKYAEQVFGGSLTQAIYCNFPSLLSQNNMCKDMINLYEFVGDLSRLMVGQNMFNGCVNLDVFVGNLSSLLDGVQMFTNTNLGVESIRQIARNLTDLTELKTFFSENEIETVEMSIPIFKIVDGMPTYEEQVTSYSVSDLGKITITWADYELLESDDRAIIVRELFPIITKKGWVLSTNLTEDNILDGDYTFTDDEELQWEQDEV